MLSINLLNFHKATDLIKWVVNQELKKAVGQIRCVAVTRYMDNLEDKELVDLQPKNHHQGANYFKTQNRDLLHCIYAKW